MNMLSFLFAAVFAAGIILGMVGLLKFFRFLPGYLRARAGNSVALHRFRFQDYVAWLADNNKNNGNALMIFAAGMALALMAFPFLLAL